MPYTKARADWISFPSTATIVRADDLDHIEQGIADAFTLAEMAPRYRLASATTAGATQLTLDRTPTEIAKGAGWLVIEPFSTNCEVRLVSSVAGAVVTPVVATSLTATSIGFVAATKRITGNVESISRFFPGQTIVVSGSASNNGTYTVDDYPTDGSYDGTYITVNETLVDETAGASVTISVNLRAHIDGTEVLFTHGPIPVTWYGAKASADTADAATNRLGIQRCLDDAYYANVDDVYLPGFMNGRYCIDAPLYLESMHLRSGHHKAGIIAAAPTFAVWNDDVAMIHTRRNGLVCVTANGGNDRYYLSHMGIDGGNVAYLKSPGFTHANYTGTGYSQTGTNTFRIAAHWVGPDLNNAPLVLRALSGGTGGNALTITFTNAGASQALEVSVVGSDITVTLATDASAVITSTIGDVIAAINADPQANLLVEASALISELATTNLAIPVAKTTFTAGSAPFVAGDVGRSIYIGQREGARKITAVTNGYTVTVDGDAFSSSYAGRKWCVSPVNGLLGSFNQTSILHDLRMEDCPGYNLFITGSQECTIRNLMSVGAGVHVRLAGSQFCRFYESNFEKSCDAFVTFENLPGDPNSVVRSISFIGTHLEGDASGIDAFRADCHVLAAIVFIQNYWTVSSISTFLKVKPTVSAGFTYSVNGLIFSGPNSGPTFIDDEVRGYTVPMTDLATGNSFEIPWWSVGPGDKIEAPWQTVSKAAAYTARLIDGTILGNAASGAFAVTLPAAAGVKGKRYTVKRLNSGANAVTIDPAGAETIDGAATLALAAQYDRATVESDGTNWMRID